MICAYTLAYTVVRGGQGKRKSAKSWKEVPVLKSAIFCSVSQVKYRLARRNKVRRQVQDRSGNTVRLGRRWWAGYEFIWEEAGSR